MGQITVLLCLKAFSSLALIVPLLKGGRDVQSGSSLEFIQ